MKNWAFARWRHFTTMTRILEGFAFLWKLGASLSLRRAGRREPWERGCAGITKFKFERKNEKDSGRSSKMTPSCKWPIARILKTHCSMNVWEVSSRIKHLFLFSSNTSVRTQKEGFTSQFCPPSHLWFLNFQDCGGIQWGHHFKNKTASA